MIVSYFVTRSVKKLQHLKRCSEKKNTSEHILKYPCFETNKWEVFRKLQSIDTLKYLFNEENLEKDGKIPHLNSWWLKLSFN